MSSNILILALTCVAMSPFVSADVAPTLCDNTCDLVGMTNACTTTINDCTAVLDDRVIRLIELLDFVLRELILFVESPLSILRPLVNAGLCIGLLNLILAVICSLVNIILLWLDGLITTNAVISLIRNWFETSRIRLNTYSDNILLYPVIRNCVTIVTQLYNSSLNNVQELR